MCLTSNYSISDWKYRIYFLSACLELYISLYFEIQNYLSDMEQVSFPSLMLPFTGFIVFCSINDTKIILIGIFTTLVTFYLVSEASKFENLSFFRFFLFWITLLNLQISVVWTIFLHIMRYCVQFENHSIEIALIRVKVAKRNLFGNFKTNSA